MQTEGIIVPLVECGYTNQDQYVEPNPLVSSPFAEYPADPLCNDPEFHPTDVKCSNTYRPQPRPEWICRLHPNQVQPPCL